MADSSHTENTSDPIHGSTNDIPPNKSTYSPQKCDISAPPSLQKFRLETSRPSDLEIPQAIEKLDENDIDNFPSCGGKNNDVDLFVQTAGNCDLTNPAIDDDDSEGTLHPSEELKEQPTSVEDSADAIPVSQVSSVPASTNSGEMNTLNVSHEIEAAENDELIDKPTSVENLLAKTQTSFSEIDPVPTSLNEGVCNKIHENSGVEGTVLVELSPTDLAEFKSPPAPPGLNEVVSNSSSEKSPAESKALLHSQSPLCPHDTSFAHREMTQVNLSENPQRQEPVSSTPSTPLVSPSHPEGQLKPVILKQPSKDGSVHQVKWIAFGGSKVPIITQNENGPCPMIAITNVLLLRGRLTLPADHEVVSSDLIIAALSEELLSYNTANLDEGMLLNYEENLSAAFNIFPTLQTGLDINIRFTGVSDFEYTPALTIFDLFRIPLYHGWVADPQDLALAQALRNQTYNQVVEMIIDYKSSSDPILIQKALLAEDFLESAASQLTMCGLCELSEHLQEGQLAILFRNNHFNTIYKRAGHIYVLVTDVGFVGEPNFVWETLNNIDGDSQFVDGDFRVCTKPTSSTPGAGTSVPTAKPLTANAAPTTTPVKDVDLSHRLTVERADLELAKRLQAEENASYLKQTPSSQLPSSSNPSQHQHHQVSSHPPAPSPSLSREAQPHPDLLLARQLQAEEDAAYGLRKSDSPHQRPQHSPPPSGQHRHRHQQEQLQSSWKCIVS